MNLVNLEKDEASSVMRASKMTGTTLLDWQVPLPPF